MSAPSNFARVFALAAALAWKSGRPLADFVGEAKRILASDVQA